jgi:tetratricopeptide (TPR) repeat protein
LRRCRQPIYLQPTARSLTRFTRTVCRRWRSRNFAEAAELFERAARLDAKPAELQFHWGECLLAQTNLAGAREHFQLACDNDALPFRADSRINAAIRAERERFGGDSLILLDAAAALAAGNGTGVCGQETFYEHVHFDFDGRYQLGLAWAEQIEPLLPRNTNVWVSQAVCEQMLGLSAWNRAQVIHSWSRECKCLR